MELNGAIFLETRAQWETSYIEGLLGDIAATEASLVTTGHEDVPVLSVLGRSQDGLPVLHGHRGDALLRDLLGHLLDRIDWDSRGNKVLSLVEPALDAVGEGHLLLCQSQGREESDERGETHLDGCGQAN